MPVPQLPFLNFLSGGVALDPAPALCDDKSEGWLRYGALRDAIKSILPILCPEDSLFAHRGLVLCALPLTVEGTMAYLSAAASGHALLMLDPGTMRLDQFIVQYEPEWIILSSALHPGEAYTRVDWPLETLVLWQRATRPQIDVHPELFLLLLPPGPPESLKTVRLSYRNIASNTLATLEALNLPPETRALLAMPLSYSFGLSLLHMMLTLGGCTLLSEHDIKNRGLWELIQKREITLFAGVPFHYEYLARALLDNLHVPRLKTFLQAGGRMSLDRTQEIARQINARAGAFFVLYGQTEASPRISVLPLHEQPDKIGTLGRVIPNGKLSIEKGRVIYEGPNVMMGYAVSRADLVKGDESNGRLPLHEEGTIDEDGFLVLG